MTALLMSALLWTAAASRLRRWWFGRPSWLLASMSVILVSLAALTTLSLAPVEQATQAVLGWPNVTHLVKQLLLAGACAGAGILLVALLGGQSERVKAQVRVQVGVSAGLAALSAALFFGAGRVPQQDSGYLFDIAYAHTPGIAESAIVAMAYPMVTCAAVTYVIAGRARPRGATGRGFVLLAWGTGLLALYAALRIGYIAAARLDLMEPTGVVFLTCRVLALTAVVLVTAGIMWSSVAGWVRGRVDRRGFDALHTHLVGLWPGVVRRSPAGAPYGDRVCDRAVELVDALGVHGRHVGLPLSGPAGTPLDRAGQIGAWLAGADRGDVSQMGLRTPSGWSERQWAVAIGRGYSAAREEL